jgi:hypothetical protein
MRANVNAQPPRGPMWEYETATGQRVRGHWESFSDFGGTDVVYRFRRPDGTLDVVSGQRLRTAVRV